MITRQSAKSMIRSGVVVNKYHINSLKNADDVVDQVFNEFEQHIKSLEAQLANTEQLKCDLELKATKLIKILDELLDVYPNEAYDLCVKHNYYNPKDTQ